MKNVLAVGGPLHGHLVTVRDDTENVIAFMPPERSTDDRPFEARPIEPALHRASGVSLLESRRDGDTYVTYGFTRVEGLLCLVADVDGLEQDTLRRKTAWAALIKYAGLETTGS